MAVDGRGGQQLLQHKRHTRQQLQLQTPLEGGRGGRGARDTTRRSSTTPFAFSCLQKRWYLRVTCIRRLLFVAALCIWPAVTLLTLHRRGASSSRLRGSSVAYVDPSSPSSSSIRNNADRVSNQGGNDVEGYMGTTEDERESSLAIHSIGDEVDLDRLKAFMGFPSEDTNGLTDTVGGPEKATTAGTAEGAIAEGLQEMKDEEEASKEEDGDSSIPDIRPLTVEELSRDRVLRSYTLPSIDVHAFYYPWYGSEAVDGQYWHWNHVRLSHWRPEIASKYDQSAHTPPEDIASVFYPALGAYSSQDEAIIDAHMLQLRRAGIGVAVVSWVPPRISTDGNGNKEVPFDALIPTLLDIAFRHDIEIAFHVEPYEGRGPASLKEDILYITQHYGSHPALHRRLRSTTRSESHDVKENDEDGGTFSWDMEQQVQYEIQRRKHGVPVLYVYDSYHISASKWATVLRADGTDSIRGKENGDAVFLALVVDRKHVDEVAHGGWDGFYTYFAGTLKIVSFNYLFYFP